MSEIKLRDTIYNEELYDSDEDIEDTNYEIIDENNDYDSPDENSEDLADILQDLLKEVAVVDILGKKAFRVEFNDTRDLDFVDRDEECDFDRDEDDYPILPDGGENFFLPYMKELTNKNKRFKKIIIETNVKGFKLIL
jgi:hypothetical protein